METIRSNEFRVGNYIHDFGIQRRILPMDLVNLSQIEQAGKICINLTCILLTEEWLLEFGFIDYRTLHNKVTKKAYFDIKIGFYQKTWNPKPKQSTLRIWHNYDYWIVVSPANGSICLQFVHQLQNLYFALTGNELTIK